MRGTNQIKVSVSDWIEQSRAGNGLKRWILIGQERDERDGLD